MMLVALISLSSYKYLLQGLVVVVHPIIHPSSSGNSVHVYCKYGTRF